MAKILKDKTIPKVNKNFIKLAGWRKRIDKAEADGGFTATDADDSGDWENCAVGEKLKLLEVPDGMREVVNLTPKASDLGHQFPDAVSSDDYDEARDILSQVEKIKVAKKSELENARNE